MSGDARCHTEKKLEAISLNLLLALNDISGSTSNVVVTTLLRSTPKCFFLAILPSLEMKKVSLKCFIILQVLLKFFKFSPYYELEGPQREPGV